MKKIKINKTNEIVYYEKLNTGLDVYLYPNDKVQSFYLTYNVKFGSMDTCIKLDDTRKVLTFPRGTAHFLEHQMFQNEGGSTAFEDFSILGSSVNAYTSYDITCYEVMSSTFFKENLETLFKFVNTPVFDDASINKEKKIITSEIDMYNNLPEAVSTFKLEYNLNINDEHKYTISGEAGDIDKIDSKTLYKAYETFYSHDNSFLILTGNFVPLEALAILKECIKKYPIVSPKKITKIKKKEPLKVASERETIKMNVNKKKISLAYKIDRKPFSSYNTFLFSTYINIILDIIYSNSGDFYSDVSKSHIIEEDFSYKGELRDDYIKIGFNYNSEYVDESVELIRNALLNYKIDKDDLSRIKKVYIASYIRSFNDIITAQENILSDILDKNEINTNIIELYEKINLKTINTVLEEIKKFNEVIFIIETD